MLLTPTSFLALFVACSSFVYGHEAFSYSEPNGPNQWPGLCKTGKEQSPIDLTYQFQQTGNTRANWVLPSVTFNHLSFGMNHWALNFNFNKNLNSSTTSSNYELDIGSHRYPLSGFHFHTPSEHSINGKHSDLELHFVHKVPQGPIAVVGVLFKQSPESGNTDSFFQQFISSMPQQKQDETLRNLDSLSLKSTFSTLFTGKPFYRYEGSLTTPPCTEKVLWTVHSEMLPVKPEYFKAIQQLLGNNARPIQHRSPGMANAGKTNSPPVANKGNGSPNSRIKNQNNRIENPNMNSKSHY